VRVGKEEPDRRRLPPAAAAEPGADARPCLPRGKALGLQVTAAFSAFSQSCTEAIQAVYPQASWQADPCHPVTHSWGPRKKSRRSSRRQVKARGAAQQPEASMALAKKL
jgi:hypothetical protein